MNKTTGAYILLWAKTMFGDVAMNKRERALRMLEEACELAQAADITLEDATAIGQRTWSRPKDTIEKEVGGLLVTVLSLCEVNGIDPEIVLLNEARRIMSKPNAHWQAKHDAKVDAGTATRLSTPRDQSLCICDFPIRVVGSSICGLCGRVDGTRKEP